MPHAYIQAESNVMIPSNFDLYILLLRYKCSFSNKNDPGRDFMTPHRKIDTYSETKLIFRLKADLIDTHLVVPMLRLFVRFKYQGQEKKKKWPSRGHSYFTKTCLFYSCST